ncbi:MAG: hypothetical protein NT154_05775, partial [Verrucomicrobia bacterium]|nr:hypothetical protein [Verrucomicrobiota bacterium]
MNTTIKAKCTFNILLSGVLMSAMMQPTMAATIVARWVGGDGNWSDASHWDIGRAPNDGGGTNYTAIITGSGASPTVTVAQNISVTVLSVSGALQVTNNATFAISSGVTNAGAISILGANLQLNGASAVNTGHAITANGGGILLNGGVIRGGSVTATNGAALVVGYYGGVLDGVVMNGTLDVGNQADIWYSLDVTNGLVLNGTALVGNPSNSSEGGITFLGSQTLSGNGTVVFGNSSANGLVPYYSGNILTIGPGITVRGQSGTIGDSSYWGGSANVGFVNQGTLWAGGTWNLIGTWTNQGMVNVTNATVSFGGVWTNSGILNVSNSTMNLDGTFLLATLGTFNHAGGTVNITGTLLNANTTLSVNALSGTWVLNGGRIRGGTVVATNGAALVVGYYGGVLDGVVVNGTLDVGNQDDIGYSLSVTNGLVLNGTALVGNPTNYSEGGITFLGSQTLSGNGTVVFGNSSYNGLVPYYSGDILTIGPGITVRGQSGTIGDSSWWSGSANVGFVNLGTISPNVSGGTILCRAESLTNSGNLSASAGATLDWEGDLQIDGAQTVVSQGGGTVRVGGSLLGNTRNVNQCSMQGTLAFGTGAHQLEVMSRDLGNVASGYVRNFAYGGIVLDSGAQVTLVDNALNSSSPAPECLYVNSLVVPSGASLDLNGFHVYTRLDQIAGDVTGGTISQAPAGGGALALGGGIPGSIASAGAMDAWTFWSKHVPSVQVSFFLMSGQSSGEAPVRLRHAVQVPAAARSVASSFG